jgi:hypothetical protein
MKDEVFLKDERGMSLFFTPKASILNNSSEENSALRSSNPFASSNPFSSNKKEKKNESGEI